MSPLAKARRVLIGNLTMLPNGTRQRAKLFRNFSCAAHDFIGGLFDLRAMTGLVEHGLFLKYASEAVIAGPDGVKVLRKGS